MMRRASAKIELGANAQTPAAVPSRGWWDITKRIWVNSGTHHLGLMSAGVAFYAFLSFVPLLGALVMSYGIVADPSAVARHMQLMIELMPTDAARLINEQLLALTERATDKKGIALLIALGLSLFSASRASGAMIEALNVIYEQDDTRGLIKGTLLSILMIAVAVIVGLVGTTAAALLAFAEELIGNAGPIFGTALRVLAWLAAGALCSFALGAMYRFAPDRSDARWQWLSVGALVGTVLWLAATLLFGVYVANFGDYDATYGSLGAVAVLLMWLFLSAYAVLIGAMINAEAERQTARDSTTGPARPMGSRGAKMADTSAALEQKV